MNGKKKSGNKHSDHGLNLSPLKPIIEVYIPDNNNAKITLNVVSNFLIFIHILYKNIYITKVEILDIIKQNIEFGFPQIKIANINIKIP